MLAAVAFGGDAHLVHLVRHDGKAQAQRSFQCVGGQVWGYAAHLYYVALYFFDLKLVFVGTVLFRKLPLLKIVVRDLVVGKPDDVPLVAERPLQHDLTVVYNAKQVHYYLY